MTQRKDQVTAHVQLGGMINYIPCSVEVGEVTTLPAGSDATVTNSGNEHQIVLDFGLPKGDKGEQGETGETGKSAYEYAVEQGYEGTEEDFGESLTTIDTKAAQAESAAGAASLSANNANVYATAANNSAAGAAQSAANAADSEQNAATSAASAQSHAVNAANSALLAGQAVTSANASASAAATQAANAANSATNAAQMASAASTSASAASASADTASAVLEDPDFVAVAGATEDIATVASSVSDIGTVAGISEDVSKVADNSADISAVAADLDNIDEVATKVAEWTPPSDWVDIRSGALDNSVYYLVAHSVPVLGNGVYTIANYPKWGIRANATTHSNTCDIYIDGIKVTTAAYNTNTIIDFPSLYAEGIIENGPITNNPSELVTHVIRVTPTVATDKIERIQAANISGQVLQGVLWVHFETDNFINTISLLGSSSTTAQNRLCKAITAKNDELKIHIGTSADSSGIAYLTMGLHNDPNLDVFKHLPTLVGDNPNINTYAYQMCLRLTPSIKKLRLKNIQLDYSQLNGFRGEVIETDIPICMQTQPSVQDGYFGNTNGQLRQLKKLPLSTFDDSWRGWTRTGFVAIEMARLEPTFLDFSNFTKQTLLMVQGKQIYPTRGIKGVIVSSDAPFNSTMSPQINVAYTGLDRQALRRLFKSMPTVSANQVCNVANATGAADLTAEDLAIATDKGWTVTR